MHIYSSIYIYEGKDDVGIQKALVLHSKDQKTVGERKLVYHKNKQASKQERKTNPMIKKNENKTPRKIPSTLNVS